MASQLDICNRALLAIGARAQVSSISPSDGSNEANACAVLFTPTFEALGRSARWNCLRKQVTLSLLEAATGTPENPLGTTLPLPPTPWLYAYQYPSDCLSMRYIVPSLNSANETVPPTTINNASQTVFPISSQIPFAVAYDTDASGNPITTILTNQSQAQAVYTVNQPNPIIWDSQFQAAMVASLAAYLVPALTLNLQLMQMQVKLADSIIATARAGDGNEAVICQDHQPDWITARSGASGYYYGYGAYSFMGYGYQDMIWPGG